jgi:hypothetical protein
MAWPPDQQACRPAERREGLSQGIPGRSLRAGDPAVNPMPERGTPAADAFLAIQRLARNTRGDVHELLTLYALEGLLARTAESIWRDEFVLKGGVLLAAFDLRRPTKDIDLQATGLPNDTEAVRSRIGEIAGLDLGDGLVFDLDSISAQAIRDEDEYAGVRVRLVGELGRSRLSVGVDVNFGDPIWPRPAEIVVPRLIETGQKPLRLLGYPLEMVVAEKIVTAIERGEANTRWRDFADVLAISRSQVFADGVVREALTVVADHRGVVLRPLLPGLETMAEVAESKWAAWRRRLLLGKHLPATFAETLSEVAVFIDPLLESSRVNKVWNPQLRAWS